MESSGEPAQSKESPTQEYVVHFLGTYKLNRLQISGCLWGNAFRKLLLVGFWGAYYTLKYIAKTITRPQEAPTIQLLQSHLAFKILHL